MSIYLMIAEYSKTRQTILLQARSEDLAYAEAREIFPGADISVRLY